MSFLALAPMLRQTFSVGDGLAGPATGDTQIFVVPSGAMRRFLGFIDSFSGTQPGWYGDNSGSIGVQLSIVDERVLDVVPGGAHAFCVLSARGYALRGGARIGYVMPWAARVQVEVLEATGRLVRRLGRDEVEGAGERAPVGRSRRPRSERSTGALLRAHAPAAEPR